LKILILISALFAASIAAPVPTPVVIDTHLEMIDNTGLESTFPDFKKIGRRGG
jgi:hypothetical protein